MKESNKRNGVAHVPTCATWPPPWMDTRPVSEPPKAESAEDTASVSPATVHEGQKSNSHDVSLIPDGAGRIAALREHLAKLASDPAWRDGWKHRTNNPDAWKSAVRVVANILDDANPASELDGLERWFHRVVSGEQYESVKAIEPSEAQS